MANTLSVLKSDIKKTSCGKRNLGAVYEYKNEEINFWVEDISILSKIVKIEPQTVQICFVSDYKNKITYYMRTIPQIYKQLQKLIPATPNQIKCSGVDCLLLSLLMKLGGLGIPIFEQLTNN